MQHPRRHPLRVWLLILTLLCLGASKQYYAPLTPVLTFADAGQTPAAGGTLVQWTLSNVTSGRGQLSNRYDKGVTPTASQPAWWEARCRVSLTGANVIGAGLELYVVTSDGTDADGALGTADASVTSADKRRNLFSVGVLQVDQGTTNTTMVASFRNIFIPERYFSLLLWNGTSLPTETSPTKHRCTMTAIVPEQQ